MEIASFPILRQFGNLEKQIATHNRHLTLFQQSWGASQAVSQRQMDLRYYWEPFCFLGMLGCFADGRNVECRFCGDGDFVDTWQTGCGRPFPRCGRSAVTALGLPRMSPAKRQRRPPAQQQPQKAHFWEKMCYGVVYCYAVSCCTVWC